MPTRPAQEEYQLACDVQRDLAALAAEVARADDREKARAIAEKGAKEGKWFYSAMPGPADAFALHQAFRSSTIRTPAGSREEVRDWKALRTSLQPLHDALARMHRSQQARFAGMRPYSSEVFGFELTRMVLPFVDASKIETPAQQTLVLGMLREVLPRAARAAVELHLETSLGPAEFTALLAQLPHPMLKANYDSGNSSSLGYRPAEEFAAYGERLGSVHIKDRALHGTTKPLGEGDADLEAVFSGLRRLNYSGDFILQVARGTPGDEVAWARHNLAYVERYLT